jgi:hypothetical protein
VSRRIIKVEIRTISRILVSVIVVVGYLTSGILQRLAVIGIVVPHSPVLPYCKSGIASGYSGEKNSRGKEQRDSKGYLVHGEPQEV